jgi:alpha-beta hydrolase superfamily lysophospholipase
VLLLLATHDPWGEQNRSALPRFLDAVPHADVRWLEDCSHAILADRGPELGVEIADWLQQHT